MFAFSLFAIGQESPTGQAAVSYSSVSQLNGILSQLEQASQSTQLDLAKLRIEKWKVDSDSKRDTLARAESVQRNLQGALPEIIRELRGAPESLASTFKMYRNLGALYDVFGSVVEAAGAFGSKDDFQTLGNDLSAFDRARRAMADRMETLSAGKEAEILRLRAELQKAQASAPPAPPKKVVVDDTTPVKKPAPKKLPPKAGSAAKPAATPATSQPH
ncbi:MAG: hypothetical protein JST79_07805 [Acidobacteria bacterium]|nr:hypothetical protein [Acidobacteriota bacterium]